MKTTPTQALLLSAILVLSSCFSSENKNVVNIYSHRHYDVDKEIYKAFEKETDIQVNVLEDDADKLMVRLKNEGENSPCDILMTADAGRLLKAADEDLFMPINSEVLNKNIPEKYRDAKGLWFAFTMRARVIVCDPAKFNSDSLLNYENLADPKYKGKVLMRSSDNVYNQSLVAGMIEHLGFDSVQTWAKQVVANFARQPKGGDKDQVLAIAAGEGWLTLSNTYYLGRMLLSDNPEEVKAMERMKVIFPNQSSYGTHINISGAGVVKSGPNRANAIRLLEFMSSKTIQAKYAEGNNEYPVHPDVALPQLLEKWGPFKRDSIAFDYLYKNNLDAVKIFNAAGWN